MAPRSQLHLILKEIVGNVYYQPGSNITMQYPCIVYKLDNENEKFANNLKYNRTRRYQVTVIDRDPDTKLPDKVSDLPLSSFNRFFAGDQLNHFVYNLYF